MMYSHASERIRCYGCACEPLIKSRPPLDAIDQSHVYVPPNSYYVYDIFSEETGTLERNCPMLYDGDDVATEETSESRADASEVMF